MFALLQHLNDIVKPTVLNVFIKINKQIYIKYTWGIPESNDTEINITFIYQTNNGSTADVNLNVLAINLDRRIVYIR